MGLGAFWEGYGTGFFIYLFFLERWRCKQLQSKTLMTGRKRRGRGLAERCTARIISRLVSGRGALRSEAVSHAPILILLVLWHQWRKAVGSNHDVASRSTLVAHRQAAAARA